MTRRNEYFTFQMFMASFSGAHNTIRIFIVGTLITFLTVLNSYCFATGCQRCATDTSLSEDY